MSWARSDAVERCFYCGEAAAGALTTEQRTLLCAAHLGGWQRLLAGLERYEPPAGLELADLAAPFAPGAVRRRPRRQ